MNKLIAGLILVSLMSACGIRKPYGSPCPPEPAQAYHAKWDGHVWYCPANTDTWVSEKEAVEGSQDYVYCVPKTTVELEGIK